MVNVAGAPTGRYMLPSGSCPFVVLSEAKHLLAERRCFASLSMTRPRSDAGYF